MVYIYNSNDLLKINSHVLIKQNGLGDQKTRLNLQRCDARDPMVCAEFPYPNSVTFS